MALRTIEPFLNLTHPYSASFYGYGQQMILNGVPFVCYSGDTGSYARSITVTLETGDWMKISSVESVFGRRLVACGTLFSNLGITFTADSVVYGGVRMKVGLSIPTHLITTQGVVPQALVMSSQIPGGLKLDTEYYLEWCIDIPNSLVRVRIDGTEVPSVALNSTVRTALLAGSHYLMYGTWQHVSTAALEYYVKDGYVLEKTPDGLMSGWLGPQTTRRLPVAEIVAPWTATDGMAPVSALNAPLGTVESRTTPVVTSDTSATEALVKIDTSSIQGRLNGVSFNVMMQRAPGKVANLEVSVSAEGVDGDKTTLVATADMLVSSRLLVGSKAPNGDAWTANTLAAATLKLKPTS